MNTRFNPARDLAAVRAWGSVIRVVVTLAVMFLAIVGAAQLRCEYGGNPNAAICKW